MGNMTGIEWTDATWSPITGCTPVGEGCEHCYAERMARRFAGRNGYPPAPHHFDVTLHPEKLIEPLHWRKPRRVFVCSMSDLFHPDVPVDYIDKVFAVMAACPQHTFQVLTKRPERMLEYFLTLGTDGSDAADRLSDATFGMGFDDSCGCWISNWINGWSSYKGCNDNNPCNGTVPRWPLPNVWLMISAENQKTLDARLPYLMQCPAAVRGVSLEPLLGGITIDKRALTGAPRDVSDWHGYYPKLDWVIVGGETGPGARPMNPDWVRSLRDQCRDAGVAFYLKQWGEYAEIPIGSITRDDGRYCIAEANGDTHQVNGNYEVRGVNTGAALMHRVGKRRAGHLLDGVEYREYPEVK